MQHLSANQPSISPHHPFPQRDYTPATTSITRLHKKIIELDIPANIIAERAGIKTTRLSEYRHGKRSIPMGTLIVLCDVLGCEAEDISGEVEVETL